MQPLNAQKTKKGRLHELTVDPKRTLLVGTYSNETKDKKTCQEHLDELASLGDTYGVQTVIKLPCPLRKIEAGTYLGKGKVSEIQEIVQDQAIDLVIFDDEISPQQQRNLEKTFEAVVIDRTELILEVFAQRAQTREAKIQVELANFRYQMPRLRRLWTHLHRQRSGGATGGFVKGEGEKQIELDRRIIRRRIENLEKDLEKVKKQRKTQRGLREKTQIPTFAIIGYTNAGKSTLLKALTDAEVLVEDKLFATLDPTTRKFVLPNGQAILLVDTVGFIRKIPHQLVAAFKSTLEEAVQADILLHIVDASNPHALSQVDSTFAVLKELGATKHPMITALNKVDQVEDPMILQKLRIKCRKTVRISALEKKGLDELQDKMVQEISHLHKRVKLRVPQSHYALVTEIMMLGKVVSSEYEENDILLVADIPHALERKIFHFICS